jgi:xanthine dehydrogenase YagS FAD-binding subunit
MNRFAMATPTRFADASELVKGKGGGKYSLVVLKGGGIDLVDHLKEGLVEPDLIVNIKRIRGDGGPISATPTSPDGARNLGTAGREVGGTIRIEATATLAEIAASDLIVKNVPVLALAAGNAASPQVRNVATAAGNLLQRPRCWYYRHEQFDCLKKGGPTCYAVEGENKYHAIFGEGPCHIVHPSNLAPALMVCNGVVHVIGGDRESIPLAELFHMPDKGVRSEHNLKDGEVVTHITCTPALRSGFYAIKEKQSFDWPLCAASVALELDGDAIRSASVCAGAVAPVPWPLPSVESALKGVSVGDDAGLRKACAVAVEGAKPMRDNAYKNKLLPVAVRRAVLIAAGRKTEVDA